MKSEQITKLFAEAIEIAIPQSSLTVSQWADTYRFLSPERSARPGRWSNELVPYLTEIMDTVTAPGVKEIVFISSSQSAKTEFLSNVIGYFMHADPSPLLYVGETEDKAAAYSKECLATMIRDTPVLNNIVSDSRARDGGNNIEEKSFPGGHLAIAWATSPATLSSRPRRVILLDERDAYKATAEGDPAKLAEKRATTFDDAIVLKASTPRNRAELPAGSPPDAQRFTAIELEYHNSDRRKYFVPCPHCKEMQTLVWHDDTGFRLQWPEGEPEKAYYVCVNGCVIEHDSKAWMLANGEWRAERPHKGRVGFFIWEGYSPFTTWGEMAMEFLEAKQSRETLKVFVNTSLAEGWEDKVDMKSIADLQDRREPYYGEYLPEGVLVLTAGVDVQGDRLEVEITGWGLEQESWSIDYHVLLGDPGQLQVWRDLQELLTRQFEFELALKGSKDSVAQINKLDIAAVCIDSGGHHTEAVYEVCRQNAGRRWFAIKGAATPGKPLVSPPTKQGRPPVRLYTIGTEAAKDTFAAHLTITDPGPGYCHFPTEFDREGIPVYGENYFKQLRSEHVITKHHRGVSVRQWVKIKASLRNEALDCRVYAMAAERILNPDYRILMRRRETISMPIPDETPNETGARQEQVEQTGRRVSRNRFANRW